VSTVIIYLISKRLLSAVQLAV